VGPEPYDLNQPPQNEFDAAPSGTSSAPVTANVTTGTPLTTETGTIDALVSVPGVTTAYTLTYTLSDANGVVRTASLPGLQGSELSLTLTNVPAAPNYVLGVNVNTDNGTVGCVGSKAFSLTPGTTNAVDVTATCSQGLPATAVPDAGTRPDASAPKPDASTVISGLGTLAATVQVPAGVDIPTLSLVLLDSTGVITQNTISIEGVPTPNFQYRNVPAGTDEMLEVQGKTSDGSELCTSSSTFTIVPDQTTNATIFLSCAPAH
jgi:hypothetical protein